MLRLNSTLHFHIAVLFPVLFCLFSAGCPQTTHAGQLDFSHHHDTPTYHGRIRDYQITYPRVTFTFDDGTEVIYLNFALPDRAEARRLGFARWPAQWIN